MLDKEMAPKKHDPAFPKWKYHKNGKSKIVHSKAGEALLGPEWKDSPADHGVLTYPHSDEYLAQAGLGPDGDSFDDMPEPEVEKPRRGRPPKPTE